MTAAIGSSTAYDLATAQFLSTNVGLAYQQFDNPQWNGQIPADLLPEGYTQIAAFKVPELNLEAAQQTFLSLHPQLRPLTSANLAALSDADALALNQQLTTALEDPATLNAIITSAAAPLADDAGIGSVWFGFALAPTSENLTGSNTIAIRGTRTPQEWALDATALLVPVPLPWFSDGKLKFSRVHLGFLILFAFLKPQMDAAVKQFNANATGTLVAGHSLGGALATLTSVYVKLTNLLTPLQMYNQASPRVGDPTFVSAYNWFVPSSFRIVNLADVVPVLPPVSFGYGDVGTEYSYLWQTGDVGNNHGWAFNYDPSTQKGIPTDAARSYPNTGIPC